MADYWKSQPKKFCQYCKCWIADNKPSIEFHERGKNHKQNVAAKIEEIKKKSIDKAKQDDKMSKEFAAMEEAAMKAYEEDMKRLQAESGTTVSEPQTKSLQPEKQNKKLKKTPSPEAGSNSESDAWVQSLTDDGNVYYYNTVTGDSQWEMPEGFQGQTETVTQAEEPNESGSPWMEAVSPDGYTYYYNTETGESSWEKPAGYPSDSSGEAASASGEEPSPPKPESLSEEESSSNGDKPTAGAAEEPKQSNAPKISFRKKKEKSEPSEKEEEAGEEAEGGTGAEGEEVKGQEDGPSSEKDQEKVQDKKEEEEEQERPAKKPRINPYGVWEEIQEEENPFESVDLQLPQVDTGGAPSGPEVAPEPKPKFRERTITSLGDEGDSGATFRKRRAENGKSRSLRQRGKDN